MKRILILSLSLLAACGGGSGGGSTPEQTFEKMRNAAKNQDWKTLFACMDPEGSDMILIGMAMGAGFTVMNNKEAEAELKTVMTKHNFPEKPNVTMGGGDKEKNKAAAKEALKDVKDKPGLFQGIFTIMQKYAKDKDTFSQKFNDATIKDVKIDGDKATATATSGDGKNSDTINFVKRGGLWYMSMDK